MTRRSIVQLAILSLLSGYSEAWGASVACAEHPRLYYPPSELPALRKLRSSGMQRHIWHNLRESADWCLTLQPRRDWIAPVASDPNYENLYDLFFFNMGAPPVTYPLPLPDALRS